MPGDGRINRYCAVHTEKRSGKPSPTLYNTGCIDNLGHLSAGWIAQERDEPALRHPMLADRWITVMIRQIHTRAQEKLGHIW